MGDTDSNNFVTYTLLRQQSTQLSYYALETGTVKITENKAHPTKDGHRLISGTINVVAHSTVDNQSTTLKGSFVDLEYRD